MGEAIRNPQHFEFPRAIERPEVEAGPLAEVRRAAPKVDGDVPDVAGKDPNKLSLGFAELIMKAAENSFYGVGLVVLDKLGGESGGGEGIFVEDFSKPTATISESSGLKEFDVPKWGFEDLHLCSVFGGSPRYEGTGEAQARNGTNKKRSTILGASQKCKTSKLKTVAETDTLTHNGRLKFFPVVDTSTKGPGPKEETT